MFIYYLQFPAMFLVILGYNWWVLFAEMEKLNIFYLLSNPLKDERENRIFWGKNMAIYLGEDADYRCQLPVLR
jgi:hypothetical protein